MLRNGGHSASGVTSTHGSESSAASMLRCMVASAVFTGKLPGRRRFAALERSGFQQLRNHICWGSAGSIMYLKYAVC